MHLLFFALEVITCNLPIFFNWGCWRTGWKQNGKN